MPDKKKSYTQHPTVAISDAFNAAGHLLAAQILWDTANHKAAALGNLIVAVAASVGVLRFGLSERIFAKANGDLADLAGALRYMRVRCVRCMWVP